MGQSERLWIYLVVLCLYRKGHVDKARTQLRMLKNKCLHNALFFSVL